MLDMTLAIGKLKSLVLIYPLMLPLPLGQEFEQRNVFTYIHNICKGHPWSSRGQNRVVQTKEGIKYLINVNRFEKIVLFIGINYTNI